MNPCRCPFTAGELVALGAIVETHPNPPAGAARLAQACYQHARTMHPTVREEPTDDA